MNIVGQICKNCFPKDKLNILYTCLHERNDCNLAKTGHNFYALRTPQVKDWNYTYAKLPNNFTLLNPNKGNNQIPIELDIDLVISGNKFGAFQLLQPICQQYKIPLISVEHTGPVPNWPRQQLEYLCQMNGNVNVFITKWSQQQWGYDDKNSIVINHGIDTKIFKQDNSIKKEKYILSVCNQFSRPERHWCCGFPIWAKVTEGLPRKHLGGDDPTFSQPAKSIEDLAYHYNQASVFINTTIVSPIPTVILENMACGGITISTNNCEIPNVIKHGYNGFLTNDESEMRDILIEVLENNEKYNFIRQNAIKTINEKYSLEKFVDNWNKLFWKTYQDSI